jgi:hypothetical protein
MPTQKEYIPWTPREEDALEDWLHEHAHLKWAQRAQHYPKPRTVDGLRSKLRAMRLGERRHSRIRTQHRHQRRTSPATDGPTDGPTEGTRPGQSRRTSPERTRCEPRSAELCCRPRRPRCSYPKSQHAHAERKCESRLQPGHPRGRPPRAPRVIVARDDFRTVSPRICHAVTFSIIVLLTTA